MRLLPKHCGKKSYRMPKNVNTLEDFTGAMILLQKESKAVLAVIGVGHTWQ